MTAGGEHEGVCGGVPGNARQIATAESLRSDVVEQCSRFSVPDVDVASCQGGPVRQRRIDT